MKQNFRGVSLILFSLSTFVWILLTLFESLLVGISLTAEKGITFLLLVFPTIAGTVLGVLSLARREGRPWLAVTAILLNALFALFQLMILVFAG